MDLPTSLDVMVPAVTRRIPLVSSSEATSQLPCQSLQRLGWWDVRCCFGGDGACTYRTTRILASEAGDMTDVDRLVHYIRQKLRDLNHGLSTVEYHYSSIPLCVIDAVFSIGVRYESTERTVQEFCQTYGWPMARRNDGTEKTISDLLAILQKYENRWEEMANIVFRNRQRTSSRSGILKAEAVYRFAEVLRRFGIETFADAQRLGLQDSVRRAIAMIPGQSSGISYDYFLMLVGHTDHVKADRMVRRFVADALGIRDVQPDDCRRLNRK